ncbi:MAG TPA: dCTP deaminase [Acidobacteriota bacterium]|nr:dCTP deaminase [Acidobacteriota bacterium]
MSIKSDHWIRRMAVQEKMIEPFEPNQVRRADNGRIISYGTSSYGYDVRCANEFKIFTNINSTIVDPKQFDEKNFVDVHADVCIIPPNSFALARTVEYFRIPRSVLTICLGKSTYARCFSGDTRVALVDGSAPTLEEMARRHERGELFWGYSIGPNGRIIVSLLDAPRFIESSELVEVTLDDGEVIRATPDHQFLRRDGRTAAAAELRPDDSLMPLYRDVKRGYEMVYQPINGHMYPTHRLADEWNIHHGIYADAAGTHRHHVDFDRLNNKPTNIERMSASEHIRMHNADTYGPEFDPREHGNAIRASFARLSADPEWRERVSRAQSMRAAQFWSEPPMQRSRQAERMVEVWARDDGSRRRAQATVARSINLRPEIDEATVLQALDRTGSIRGAARLLNCDRSVFRKFPEVLGAFRGTPGRNHRVARVRSLPGQHDTYCLTVPEAGNFALEAGVFVRNCGIIVNVTPLEPEWEGHVTLEFSNTTPLPAKIYANEGIAQMIFFEADEICSVSYKDRDGKYQGQKGVTLPKA